MTDLPAGSSPPPHPFDQGAVPPPATAPPLSTPVTTPDASSAVPLDGPPTAIGEVPIGDVEWKRPHPYTLIIEFISSVRDLILPIIFIFMQGSGDSGSVLAEVLPMVAILLPVGFAVARYFTTRYALTDEALLHQFGVLKKSKQVLPRRNIQNLSTSAGLIARATNLVELTISDASQGGDITLRLLSNEDAESLMSLLRETSAAALVTPESADGQTLDGAADGFAPPSAAQVMDSDPIHTLDLGDLFKFRTVTSGGPVLAIVMIVGLVIAYFSFPDLADDLTFSSALFILGPLSAVLVPLLAPMLSLGGFRLWSDPDRLRIKTGLLTEVQVNARRERIQLVQVDRHVLAQRIGLESVKFETADVEQGGGQISFLAPAVASESWTTFASDALGEVELGEDDLQRVSPLTQRRSLVRFGSGGVPLVAALIAATIAAPGNNGFVVGLVSLIVMGLYVMFAMWFAARRARRLGWAVGHDQFLFRNGVVAEKLILVRKEKLQVLRISQSFFQRRLGLATLTLGTAGLGLLGLVSLPDLETETADRLLHELAEASAATPLARTL